MTRNRLIMTISYILKTSLLGLILNVASPGGSKASCEINDLFSTDSAGNRIITEKIAKVASPSLIDSLAFDFTETTLKQQTLVADVSVNVVIDQVACPSFRFPLGLVFRGASMPLENPIDVNLTPSSGRANISFDAERFSATLKTIIPLPNGYNYRPTLTTVPSTIDGTVLDIDIVAPAPLGTLLQVKWTLDRTLPDYGLKALADSIAGHASNLGGDRAAAIANVRAALRNKIKDFLSNYKSDLGPIQVTSLAVANWDRWDAGDPAFTATIEWKGADASIVQLLPASAELRFDSNGTAHLVLPPINTEELRSFLAKQVAAKLPDPKVLDEITNRFGDVAARSMPAGWLRVKNAFITQAALSADVAFSIDEEVSSRSWQALKINFPASMDAVNPVVATLAGAAGASITDYLAKVAEDTIYKAASDFVNAHRGQTVSLFGFNFAIELVASKDGKLPPKPMVQLSAPSEGVRISDVGLIVSNGTPVFDWSTAHIEGADKLANLILKKSGLQGGNLSLAVGSVALSNGRLAGELKGNLLGYDFSAPFSVGEKDTALSLPTIHQALAQALQNVLANRELSLLGLKLNNLAVCPDGPGVGDCSGNDLGLGAKFAIQDIFAGEAKLKVYPSLDLKITKIDPSPGFSALTNLFNTGTINVNLPTNFSPLVLSGTITVPPVFNVITIPPVPFQWSSDTGKVTLGFPTTIPIDTDVFIPPWLNLSQVRVPVAKNADGSITIGAIMTLFEHTVQYVFNIDGTMQAHPDSSTVKVAGKASLLSLPIYQVDGQIDFPKKELDSVAHTLGLLKAIVDQEGKLHVSGDRCLISQQDHVTFLFFQLEGALHIQPPSAACGHPIAPEAASCGITGAGGLCLGAKAHVGSLTDFDVQLKAGFDLKPSVVADGYVNILTIDVGLNLEANESLLKVKARAKLPQPVGDVKFGFSIANPKAGSDANVRDILNDIIRQLLKLNIDLSKPISFSDSEGDTGQTEVSPNDNKDPSTPPVTPGPKPVPPEPEPPKPVPPEPVPPEPVPPKPVPPVPDTEVQPLEEGPLSLTFDAAGHMVQTNRDTHVTRTSSQAVEASVIPIVKACTNWESFKSVGERTDPVDADAIILVNSPSGCDQACVTSQICAVALRGSPSQTTPTTIAPTMSWLNFGEVISRHRKANDLEKEIVVQFTRSKLFPETNPPPATGTWTCPFPKDIGCDLAIETAAPNDDRAYISTRSSIISLDHRSLLYWAAGLVDGSIRNDLFLAATANSLKLFGQTDKAWLVDRGGGTPSTGTGLIIRDGGRFIPLAFAPGTDEAWYPASSPAPSSVDAVLTKSIEVLAENSGQNNWILDDLGSVDGGRRILLLSDSNAFLILPGTNSRPQERHRARADIPRLSCVEGSSTMDLGPWLHKALTLPAQKWRADGCTTNPVLSIFPRS